MIPTAVTEALTKLASDAAMLGEAREDQAEKAAVLAQAAAAKDAADVEVTNGVTAVQMDREALIAAIIAAYPDGNTVQATGGCQSAPQSTSRKAVFVGILADDSAERAAARFVRAAVMVVARIKGWDRAKVASLLTKMEGERPWLDWIKDGGLEQILAFIIALMNAFK